VGASLHAPTLPHMDCPSPRPRPQFLDFFLKGNLSLEPAARPQPHEWLPDQGWQDIVGLAELAAGKLGPDGAPGGS
jgi:hypothetical protein